MKLSKLQSLSEVSKGESAVDFSDHIESLRDAGMSDELANVLQKAGANLLKNGFTYNARTQEFRNTVFKISAPRKDFYRADIAKGAGWYFIDENIRTFFIMPAWKQLMDMDIKGAMKLFEDIQALNEKRKELSEAAPLVWSVW